MQVDFRNCNAMGSPIFRDVPSSSVHSIYDQQDLVPHAVI
jgi:hypothetical protein